MTINTILNEINDLFDLSNPATTGLFPVRFLGEDDGQRSLTLAPTFTTTTVYDKLFFGAPSPQGNNFNHGAQFGDFITITDITTNPDNILPTGTVTPEGLPLQPVMTISRFGDLPLPEDMEYSIEYNENISSASSAFGYSQGVYDEIDSSYKFPTTYRTASEDFYYALSGMDDSFEDYGVNLKLLVPLPFLTTTGSIELPISLIPPTEYNKDRGKGVLDAVIQLTLDVGTLPRFPVIDYTIRYTDGLHEEIISDSVAGSRIEVANLEVDLRPIVFDITWNSKRYRVSLESGTLTYLGSSYKAGDIVTFEGNQYEALVDQDDSILPITDRTAWIPFVNRIMLSDALVGYKETDDSYSCNLVITSPDDKHRTNFIGNLVDGIERIKRANNLTGVLSMTHSPIQNGVIQSILSFKLKQKGT